MIEEVTTKDRILDSAEKLFGSKGFDATSLRDITSDAVVNLAAVNYHFQSKESLIQAVIARRLEPINRKRLEMLDALPPGASLEQILTAFLAPPLEAQFIPVIPLIGKVLSDPKHFLESIYPQHFSAVAARFRAALQGALPSLPEEEVLWRLQFAVGAMTHILNWGMVLPALTGGICHLENRQLLIERAVAFLAAGFRSPAIKNLHHAS